MRFRCLANDAIVNADELTKGASQANLQRVINRKLKEIQNGPEIIEVLKTAESCEWQSNFLSYFRAIHVC